ncbi:MAG: heat-inducible transcriptional repressor HrcA [Candidatus Sericytochromatia bacterium]|nr:heat-inducible transcriptional repressor HrcA [Candidatus Sericytochromatia bacterium]
MTLSPRQQAILKAIIEDYILTAEPVGSRVLAKKFSFGLSPATLRNEMADLEDEGLLRQPHTSAGRIPSDAGYRVFVDLLMDRHGELSAEELGPSRVTFDERDLHEILQQAARATAVLAQCTAIVRAPRQHVARVQFLQLVPLGPREVMVVIITDRGRTLNRRVALPTEMAEDELATLTSVLNHHLRGQPLNSLTGRLLDGLLAELREYEALLAALWERIAASPERDERVFVANASFLAQQPEFNELEKIRSLLTLLEREQALAEMMARVSPAGQQPGTRVAIGHENPLVDLHECSVVMAPYAVGGQVVGEIGVMGPTRLGYPRAIAAVEAMAQHLSHHLTRVFGYKGS